MIDNGLVECYVTVRWLGAAQAFTGLAQAVVIGMCVWWLIHPASQRSREV